MGIRHALKHGADLIWLLNNDTEVAPDCVAELLAAAAAHPECALFGPKILLYDRPQVLWYAGGHVHLHRPAGSSHLGLFESDRPRYDEPGPISFVTGCALLIRRSAVETIGELDGDLFIYSEDLDWSLKTARAGLRAWYVPRARLWHKVSSSYASDAGRVAQTYLAARSRFIVQRRHGSGLSVLALIPAYLGSRLARHAYRAAAGGNPRLLVALIQGMLDGLSGRARRYP